MERIVYFARLALLRALAFATLGIGTMMVGLSWDPALALMTGAGLTGIIAAVLFYKALSAPTRDYRRTEVWILLDRKHGLAEERAQEIIGDILRAQYWQYGEYAAAIAAAQWLLSVAVRLA